jgi:hypothetical protein
MYNVFKIKIKQSNQAFRGRTQTLPERNFLGISREMLVPTGPNVFFVANRKSVREFRNSKTKNNNININTKMV